MGARSMENIMKKKYMRWVIWVNLFIGICNLYYYVNNDTIYSLMIGTLNIGVWVFNRNK